jgi:hypothetical protein
MLVELNKKEYHTCIDEFNTIHHNEVYTFIKSIAKRGVSAKQEGDLSPTLRSNT